MTEYFFYWLVLINGISFVQMIYDKHLAEAGKRRIPEASLLQWMAFGGAPAGLLASKIIRHKTRKQPFAGTMSFLAFGWIFGLSVWLSGLLNPVIAEALAIFASVS